MFICKYPDVGWGEEKIKYRGFYNRFTEFTGKPNYSQTK